MAFPYRTLVAPEALAAHLGAPDLVVVDCRFSLADSSAGERAYRAGHVPGAVYAHLERDLSGPIVPGKTGRHPLPDPDAVARTLGAWGMDAGTQLVAYDDAGGSMAARLWWLARYLGHDAVAVLDGGYASWVGGGFPVSRDIPERTFRRFEAKLRPQMAVDAAEVERARRDASRRVFDARAPERFRGDVEPIDPVAGHIAGARSLPFADNLDGSRFRGADALRERYLAALGEVPAENAIVYCGSGVTACHTVLAAHHAGIPGLRLYPGSWSEWIVDPERAVARGD